MEAISDAGQRALEAVDDLLGDYKPWQVWLKHVPLSHFHPLNSPFVTQICAISIAGFIAAAKTKELLFQEVSVRFS